MSKIASKNPLMKMSQIIDLYKAIDSSCLIIDKWEIGPKSDESDREMMSELNFCLASNAKILKPLFLDFNESEQIRMNSFLMKDENKNPIMIGGQYKWINKEKAETEYRKNINKEVDIVLFKIKRNKLTDLLPAYCISEFKDVIFIS